MAPDGSWLASGAEDGTVRIWDVATGQERAVLTGHTEHGDGGGGGAGRQLAGHRRLGRDGADLGRGHRAGTGRPDRPHRRGGGGGGGAGWQLAGHRQRDRTVRIWDAATGQERAVLTGHTGWVQAVAVAPDGSWLATGGEDGTVRIWDVATGQRRGHPDRRQPGEVQRWRWRRMAAGWPPAAGTGRCGSGTWPPGRNGPS